MIIGLDFDNTIVRYDEVFHTVALEQGHINTNTPVSKVAVRDAMRADGKNDAWTEIQGYVYGRRMNLAQIYDGVKDFLKAANAGGHTCMIISHKTRLPYAGPEYDLHKSAREWIEKNLVECGEQLVKDISFHETKELKIHHIADHGCDFFLDDLPEILNHELFPPTTKPVLFDPDGHHGDEKILQAARSWGAFAKLTKI